MNNFPADKGLLGGSCNRAGCLAPGACCLNWATEAYYCEPCAKMINEREPKQKPPFCGKPQPYTV